VLKNEDNDLGIIVARLTASHPPAGLPLANSSTSDRDSKQRRSNLITYLEYELINAIRIV